MDILWPSYPCSSCELCAKIKNPVTTCETCLYAMHVLSEHSSAQLGDLSLRRSAPAPAGFFLAFFLSPASSAGGGGEGNPDASPSCALSRTTARQASTAVLSAWG